MSLGNSNLGFSGGGAGSGGGGGGGTVTSVGLTMPSAFTVTNSPITSAGSLDVTGAGLATQYIRGDGQLANFPSSGGSGSSVAYYLNGSVNQGTFGGVTYYELSKTPVFGAGTTFTRTNAAGNGYIASFITDAGDPNLLSIPAGNWGLEFYFSASASGGTPRFYGELYKVSASNVFTLIASESANPEFITNGTAVDQYFTSIAVPETVLLVTDRLAIRVYVIPSGVDITLHTEGTTLSEVITTFSTGLTALNGLTAQVQFLATGTSGTDFAINSTLATHTFNLPTASAANRGALSSADWSAFNNKIPLAGTINAAPITGRLRTTNDYGVWKQWGSFDAYASKQVITGVVSGFNNIPDDINGNATQGIHYGQVVGFGDAYSVVQAKSNDFDGGATTARIYAYANYSTGEGRIVVDAYEGLIGVISNTPYLSANSYVQKNYVDAQVATKFTLPALTSGSVLFSNGTTIAQDNANFFWDDTNNSLGIGTNTNVLTSIFTLNSVTKGFLPPRMTTTQRNGITLPATGLQLYDTTLNSPFFYNGSAWRQISPITLVNLNSLFSTGLPSTFPTGVNYANFFGDESGQAATGASFSNFLGRATGKSATNSSSSNFIGNEAGNGANNSSYSNFIGAFAGLGAANSNNSNFFGFEAGWLANSSQSNLFGLQVGKSFTGNSIGANNIIIGTNISLPNTTANAMNLGGVLFGVNTYGTTTGDPSIAATATGRIGVGIVTPTARLHIAASSTAQALMRLTVGAAPTSPNDGDIWLESNTQTGLKIRLAGVTRTFTVT